MHFFFLFIPPSRLGFGLFLVSILKSKVSWEVVVYCVYNGPFNNYVDKMRGSKMSVFVHAQGMKTVHAGDEGVKSWQNSVHVVVECPLSACYAI
jgi:hypothetical protein